MSELPKLPNVNPPVEGLSSLFVVLPKENPEVVLVSEFSVDAVVAPKLNPVGAGASVLSVVVVFPKENPGVGFDSVLPDDPKVKAEKCQQLKVSKQLAKFPNYLIILTYMVGCWAYCQ